MFTPERLRIIGHLIPVLEHNTHWDDRYQIEIYVHRCASAGFADTGDQIRLCAERYIAGKRKVTPPGTARKKKAAQRMKEMLANTPAELSAAVDAAIANGTKVVSQYKAGNDKVINSLIGAVMKLHKSDPATIRELLIHRIAEM